MKSLFIMSLFALSSFASAEFEGTMVLKGSLKSKVFVNKVETTCLAKVDKVKNILEEDSFGNPGYTVKLSVKLDGRDEKRKIEVKSSQEAWLTNFHKIGNQIQAKDAFYADEATGMTMEVDPEGRLKNVTVSFQGQKVSCLF